MKKLTLLLMGLLVLSCSHIDPKIKKKSCTDLKFTAYDECQRTYDFFILTKNYKKALFDLNGNQIIDFLYDSIYFQKNSKRGRVELKGKFAIMDNRGKLLTPFKYKSIKLLHNNYASVSLNGSKKALMNSKNKILTLYKYDDIEYLTDRLYRTFSIKFEESEPGMLHMNESSGLINSKGKEIIPLEDRSMVKLINWVDKKMIRVFSKKGIAILDTKGNEFIPFGKYDSIEQSINIPYLYIGKKGQGQDTYTMHGYIDTQGRTIIPPIYAHVQYTNGYFFVLQSFTNDITHGVLNIDNKIIVPIKYRRIEFIGNGLFKAIDKAFRVDLYNEKGEKLVSNVQEIKGSISKKGYLLVSDVNGTCCQIFNKIYDTKNQKIIPLKLDENHTRIIGYAYGGELLGIQKNKKWGFIDSKGKLIIDYQYDIDYEYNRVSTKSYGNRMIVKLNGKYGIIDKNNSVVAPFKYQMLFFMTPNRIFAKVNNKVGVIDQNGKIILPIDYKNIVYRGKNTFEVYKFDRSVFNVDLDESVK